MARKTSTTKIVMKSILSLVYAVSVGLALVGTVAIWTTQNGF